MKGRFLLQGIIRPKHVPAKLGLHITNFYLSHVQSHPCHYLYCCHHIEVFFARIVDFISFINFKQMRYYYCALIRLERLGWHSPAGKAKVFGTIVCISGAMLLSLYKGPEINMGRTNINLLHSPKHKGESKPLLGAFLAVAGCTCYALLLIVQVS